MNRAADACVPDVPTPRRTTARRARNRVAIAILLGAAGCGAPEDAPNARDARTSPSTDPDGGARAPSTTAFHREVISPEMEAAFAAVELEKMTEPLAVGTRAPPIEGVPGDRERVIVFIRGSWCPPCRRQLGELQDRLEEIERRRAALVVVSGDPMPALDAVRARMGLTYRFVSDPSFSIAAKYGVRQSDVRLQLPSVFVVDASGVIRFVQVARFTSDRARVDDVLAALDRAGTPGAAAPPPPSPRPSNVLPDPSEPLRLFPELAASPAPAWVKAGTRITYATTDTTLTGVESEARLDARGEWVTSDGLPVAGPESRNVLGLEQVGVVALTTSNAVLSVTQWGLTGGAAPARLGETAIVGTPGAGGDYWIDPAVLRRAERDVPPGTRVARHRYAAAAKTYEALWITSADDPARRLSVYDLDSGVLLHQASAIAAGATSPAASSASAARTRVLTTSTLVTIRDAAPPWAGARPPPWLPMLQFTDYVGDETTSIPGRPASSVARSRHVSIDARGPGWLRFHAEDRSTRDGTAATSSRREVRAAGPAQYFGLYVPPSALSDLRPGQELDRDPQTKFVIVVGSATHVDGREVVVITGENEMFRIEAAYDRRSGMRVHVTVHDHLRHLRRDWRLGS